MWWGSSNVNQICHTYTISSNFLLLTRERSGGWIRLLIGWIIKVPIKLVLVVLNDKHQLFFLSISNIVLIIIWIGISFSRENNILEKMGLHSEVDLNFNTWESQPLFLFFFFGYFLHFLIWKGKASAHIWSPHMNYIIWNCAPKKVCVHGYRWQLVVAALTRHSTAFTLAICSSSSLFRSFFFFPTLSILSHAIWICELYYYRFWSEKKKTKWAWKIILMNKEYYYYIRSKAYTKVELENSTFIPKCIVRKILKFKKLD